MVIWISLIFGLIVTVLFAYLQLRSHHKSYPHGPSTVPIIGNIHKLKPSRCIAYKELGKIYGDVFTVKLLSKRIVVLNTIKAIRTALIEKSSIFKFRAHLRGTTSNRKGKGLVHSNGVYWEEHRRFALRALRDFGFAKTLSANAIHTELQGFFDSMEKENGMPISTKNPFAKLTTNVISRMVFGMRLSEEERGFDDILSMTIYILENSGKPLHNLLDVMPFLSYIPFFTTLYNSINPRSRLIFKMFDYIRGNIRDHLNTIGDVSEPTDLIDALILHKLALDSENAKHTFDEDSMVFDLFDLFVAGSDTTAVTLSWGMLLLAINSNVQEMARSEIHENLGKESFPAMQDRFKLNYALAVIDEIQRFSSITPTGIMYQTSEDVNICGQNIPKDSFVIPCMYSVHRDPELWKYPDSFSPENFLDGEGKYKASENLIPFSLGKRSCLGESLARMEIFIFLVGIMQRYRVSLYDRENIDLAKLFIGSDGNVRHLIDHKIVFHVDS